MQASRAFRHRLRVRVNECDTQGIAFNANYLVFADVAITEMWGELAGSYTELVAGGVDFCVAEANVRFHSPARAEEHLDIAVTVRALGRTSLVLAVAMRRGDTAVAECTLRYVFIDPASLDGDRIVTQEIPAWLRAGLERFQEPAGAASQAS